jgi:hypothetical protein
VLILTWESPLQNSPAGLRLFTYPHYITKYLAIMHLAAHAQQEQIGHTARTSSLLGGGETAPALLLSLSPFFT